MERCDRSLFISQPATFLTITSDSLKELIKCGINCVVALTHTIQRFISLHDDDVATKRAAQVVY